MSIIAGVYAAHWTSELTEIKQKIVSHISRNPEDHRYCFHDSHLFLCQVDYQCYGESARAESKANNIYIAGHTLLSSSITADLHTLLNAENLEASLHQAQGTFCAFFYNREGKQLQVYCDTLALRPYYLMQYKGAVIFSTCLRLFPHLGVPLDNNLEAITELAALGYTLGDKTQYKQVVAARPGEMMTITPSGMQRRRYFRWADMPTGDIPFDEGISALDCGFKRAVDLYLGADCNTVSTLSGGLDSRLIATELKRRGVDLECLNFSRGCSQDAEFSAIFANAHQIPLHSITVTDLQDMTVERRLGNYWTLPNFPYYGEVDRPRLFWSGNGGSVCVGMVYTGAEVVEACKQGDPELVADKFIEQQMAYIPQRLIKQGEEYQQRLRHNVLSALGEYAYLPLLKAFQLFLWENDQHHHIASPAEDLDLYQLDFCLPFYSRAVLEVMFAMKAEWALKHELYMEWLQACYPQALVTPWQTYPGHLPCPLKNENATASQWQLEMPSSTKADLLKGSVHTMLSANGRVLSRHRLGIQCMLTSLGLYDCSSSLRFVKRMNQYMIGT